MMFVTVSCLKFEDGNLSLQMLHQGDKESCGRVADLIPAIAHSGDRKVVDSWISVIPLQQWDELLPEAGI